MMGKKTFIVGDIIYNYISLGTDVCMFGGGAGMCVAGKRVRMHFCVH